MILMKVICTYTLQVSRSYNISYSEKDNHSNTKKKLSVGPIWMIILLHIYVSGVSRRMKKKMMKIIFFRRYFKHFSSIFFFVLLESAETYAKKIGLFRFNDMQTNPPPLSQKWQMMNSCYAYVLDDFKMKKKLTKKYFFILGYKYLHFLHMF